jgi:hydrogenase nickel incorporation protein HypA/HybF
MRKIESIARERGAQRVAGFEVKLGALSHISADHFPEHFEAVARHDRRGREAAD